MFGPPDAATSDSKEQEQVVAGYHICSDSAKGRIIVVLRDECHAFIICAPCNVATSFSCDPFSSLCYLACMFGLCTFWDWLSQPPISSITARTKTKKPKNIKQKKHKNRPNSICNYGVGLPTRYMLAARRAKKTRLSHRACSGVKTNATRICTNSLF